jgi:hypothetical protein
MTNGEKIKAIFPSAEIDIGNGGNDIWIAIDCWTIFKKEWWNAEYQEPSDSENSNKSEIPTGSTTKNNLAVDCISREQALGAIRNLYPGMPRVDFNGSLRKWVDKYKPYIECDDAIKQLPSVTPQPRKGHWTEEFNDLEGEVRFTCSSCGKYQLFGTDFCYHCGAKMVEPQESEG